MTINKNRHYLRVFLSIFAPLFIISFAIPMSVYFYQKNKAVMHAVNDELQDQQIMKNLIQRDIRTIIIDLLNEVHLRELESVINDRRSANLDDLSKELLTFSKLKGVYDSIRYIDEKGRERVRISMGEKGPYIVPEKELQDKSLRYYFVETMGLENGQVYMSRFDLKMEYGAVEFPFKPEIRLAAPLFSKDGERRGIFILNYMGNRLFKDDIENVCDESLCKNFLLDAEGYYLRGPRPEDEWGFMFKEKKDISFAKNFKKEWGLVSGKSSGRFFTEKGFFSFDTIALEGEEIAGVKITSGKEGGENRWKLVSHVPEENLFPGKNILLVRLSILSAILLFAAWAAARAMALNRVRHIEAADAMRLSEQRLSMHIMNTPLGVIEWDRHFRVEEWNRAAEDIFGFTRDEALGRHASEIIVPISFHDKAKNVWDGIITKKMSEKIRFSNISKSGKMLICEWYNTPLADEAGEVVGVASLVQDVTSKVEAEEGLKETLFEMHTILDTAQVGIFFIKDDRIVWVNNQAESIFGYGKDEIIGMSLEIFHLFPGDYEFLISEASKTINEGNTFIMDHLLKRKDGSLVWCHMLARAIDKESPEKGSIWITEDVSEAKQREDDLQKAKEEAEEAVRLKDKFVSLVSHDLKGPLTVIRGYFEILRDCEANLEVLTSELSNAALECCDGMTSLINDILNISRVKGGGLKHLSKLIDVWLVVERALKKYSHLAQKKGVAIRNEVGADIRVYADERLLEEVLANLISNAVKFSRKGDEITIYVPVDREGVIAVKDTGIGIAEGRVGKLFKYEEKTSTYGTSGESGSGFGLPLARDMMLAMGGDLTLESEIGKGSTFYITVPVKVSK